MKNVVIVILFLLMCAGIGGTVYFYMQVEEANVEKNQLIQQNGELQVAIDAIGPITSVWTVNTKGIAGTAVKAEELIQQTIPVSSVTGQFLMNKEDIVGKYYKVDIEPGVSITKDILMDEPLDGITYERDMTFGYLPLGLKVGDYIDIRIVMPYGEEFVVLQHERVQQLVENSNTIKLILNEAQLALWTSAMKDYALYRSYGLGLYVTKYIEPGITDIAVPFYPVRTSMEASVLLNPNIKDKTLCINTKLRENIDLMLASVEEQDMGTLSSGVTLEAGDINNAKAGYFEKEPTGSSSGITQGNGDSNVGDIDLTYSDPNGNQSSISDQQVGDSSGDNPYGGEEAIE